MADDLMGHGSRSLRSDYKPEKVSYEPFYTNQTPGITVMQPVAPMLARAFKSIDETFKKCPKGMLSEIKYDGERVQIHKQGNTFKYFSRSLKPVQPHKVEPFHEYIPKALPHGLDLILDAEVLLVDTVTSKPLPFGTLGVHKKALFKQANVCLYIFDCLYLNGESLVHKPVKERRRILEANMIEIKNRIMFSEMKEIHKIEDLEEMMTKVFKLGLEGLVLKDIMSPYEPGRRGWLKVKKDYLFDGSMADTADLVVLGAWYGREGLSKELTTYLMGCYDKANLNWVTVTKLKANCSVPKSQFTIINKDPAKVPDWLNCTRTIVPDLVANDPKKMPVWEIKCAEYTSNSKAHTATISFRFPRIKGVRNDKDWQTATNLEELVTLFKNSRDTSGFTLVGGKRKAEGNDSKEKNSAKKQGKKCK